MTNEINYDRESYADVYGFRCSGCSATLIDTDLIDGRCECGELVIEK